MGGVDGRSLNCSNVHCYMYIFSSVATWTLTPPGDSTGWRHVRIKTNGPNASGQTHYLSVSGLELYGEVRGLADDDLGRSEWTYVRCHLSHTDSPFQARRLVKWKQL